MKLSLSNEDKLKEYITKLEERGVGSDVILTELKTIVTAIQYCRREKLILDCGRLH